MLDGIKIVMLHIADGALLVLPIFIGGMLHRF